MIDLRILILNGILAAAFLASSVLSAELPLHKGFERNFKVPKDVYSYSMVQFQKETTGSELGISRLGEIGYGPTQTIYSLSVTDNGGFWVGYGLENEITLGRNINVTTSFLPGIYQKGQDHNLGGWLMFRSGISLEYRLSNLWAVSVAYDHRSSGDIWEYNPGLETIRIQIKTGFIEPK